jgi:S-adenosylmethionine hydrolase
MNSHKHPIVTLITDFGLSDPYVASMKALILEAEPSAALVDISHEVPAHDILAGNFLLQASFSFFPPHTVHLCVIDPGVGGVRRPIIVSTDKYLFVAPDNGILSCAFESEGSFRTFEITADHYFHKPISKTFHGRDVFAPVAGWLAHGIEPFNFGPEISDPVRLELPKVRRASEHEFVGAILHIDRFGNLISNFPAADMEKVVERGRPSFQFLVENQMISQYRNSYSDAAPGELFAISGSSGYVEFSVREGSAAALTHAQRNSLVRLLFK